MVGEASMEHPEYRNGVGLWKGRGGRRPGAAGAGGSRGWKTQEKGEGPVAAFRWHQAPLLNLMGEGQGGQGWVQGRWPSFGLVGRN